MKSSTSKVATLKIISFDTLKDAQSFIEMCDASMTVNMYQDEHGVHVVIVEVLDEE